MSLLPETLYVQNGLIGPQNLFVNRTPAGAIQQLLGVGYTPGAVVGVYKLERVVRLELGVVEATPPQTTPAAAPAVIT